MSVNSLWSFSPTSELRIISWQHVDHHQVLSVVNNLLTIVACWSHSAFSFVHSTMMTVCDTMHRTVQWCQRRLVFNLHWNSNWLLFHYQLLEHSAGITTLMTILKLQLHCWLCCVFINSTGHLWYSLKYLYSPGTHQVQLHLLWSSTDDLHM